VLQLEKGKETPGTAQPLVQYPQWKLARERRLEHVDNRSEISRHERRARDRRDTYLRGFEDRFMVAPEGLRDLEPVIGCRMQKTKQGGKTHRARVAIQRHEGADRICSQLGIPYNRFRKLEAAIRNNLPRESMPHALHHLGKEIRQLKPGTRPHQEILDDGERLCRKVIAIISGMKTRDEISSYSAEYLTDLASRTLHALQNARTKISRSDSTLQ
jgi:hypothetical protein